jgi:hypothetical protein
MPANNQNIYIIGISGKSIESILLTIGVIGVGFVIFKIGKKDHVIVVA